jgi:hypothetical protein
MRRKVIKGFANAFCQRVIDLPSGYDIAFWANFGSGLYFADILSGHCNLNGYPIPELRLCGIYRTWLGAQLERHRIAPDGISRATLAVQVEISDVNIENVYGRRSASARFGFHCESEIATDEKSYIGRFTGSKIWGLDWYYEQLFGTLPEILPLNPAERSQLLEPS